jgi:hypothetical protein
MMGAGQQRRIFESLIPAANQNGHSTLWPEDCAPYAADWPQARSRGRRFASQCDIGDKLDKIRFKPLGSFFYSLMVYACGKSFIFPFLFTSSFGMSRRPFVFL